HLRRRPLEIEADGELGEDARERLAARRHLRRRRLSLRLRGGRADQRHGAAAQKEPAGNGIESVIGHVVSSSLWASFNHFGRRGNRNMSIPPPERRKSFPVALPGLSERL